MMEIKKEGGQAGRYMWRFYRQMEKDDDEKGEGGGRGGEGGAGG